MRIGIVSDIHCNLQGLNRALELMRTVDAVLCLGDVVYQYRFSNEVVHRLREVGARIVLGNHDQTFLTAYGAHAVRQQDVDPGLVAWLSQQPYRLEIRLGGKKFLLAHASPASQGWDYVYPGSTVLGSFRDMDADYILLGHTHQPMAVQVGPMVINPGSAGEPVLHDDGAWLNCAVLVPESGEVQFFRYADPRLAEYRTRMRMALVSSRRRYQQA